MGQMEWTGSSKLHNRGTIQVKNSEHFPKVTQWTFEKYWHNLSAQKGYNTDVQISPMDFPGDMTVYLNP